MGFINDRIQRKMNERTKIIGDQILPYLDDNKTVLDFGCGDMLIDEYLLKNRNVEITGIDIMDFEHPKINYIQSAGGKFPFDDNHFDIGLAIFALHQTRNPEFYFKELVRVTKSKLIILEDTYINRLEKYFTYFLIWLGDFIVYLAPITPLHFRSLDQWFKLFKDANLKLTAFKRIYPYPIPGVPLRNVVMVLKKTI